MPNSKEMSHPRCQGETDVEVWGSLGDGGVGLPGAARSGRVSSGPRLPSDSPAGPNPALAPTGISLRSPPAHQRPSSWGNGGSLPLPAWHRAPLSRTGRSCLDGLSALALPFLPTTPTQPTDSCKGADLTQRHYNLANSMRQAFLQHLLCATHSLSGGRAYSHQHFTSKEKKAPRACAQGPVASFRSRTHDSKKHCFSVEQPGTVSPSPPQALYPHPHGPEALWETPGVRAAVQGQQGKAHVGLRGSSAPSLSSRPPRWAACSLPRPCSLSPPPPGAQRLPGLEGPPSHPRLWGPPLGQPPDPSAPAPPLPPLLVVLITRKGNDSPQLSRQCV